MSSSTSATTTMENTSVPVKTKFMYLDTLSTKGLVFSALCFFISLFIMVIVGAYGPVAGKSIEYPLTTTCSNPQNCTTILSLVLPDLSPFNQATWFTARMQRPILISTNKPALPASSFRYTQSYFTDVIADGTVLASNVPHNVEVNCQPYQDVCSGMLIFAAAHIYYTKYTVKVTLVNPQLPYAQFGNDLSPNVGVTLRHGYIADEYTMFEIGWKVFFLVITAIIVIAFIVRQITGPGSRNDLRKIIPSTTEQKWIMALGILLFFYNDPTFPTYISKPSLIFSGFYAVCSFTFIATILLYWLVMFDLARLQGEAGLHVSIDSLPPHQRPGACFWVPKILIICTIWTIAIASYMYARIMQLEDPTFSIFENVGQQVVQWFGTFVAGLGGVYVLYIFALMVLGCRHIKNMRSSSRFLLIVTITALIVILIGLFLNSYTALRETSAAFLSGAGVANIYVWTLMILHLPVEDPNKKDDHQELEPTPTTDNGGDNNEEEDEAPIPSIVLDVPSTNNTNEEFSSVPTKMIVESNEVTQNDIGITIDNNNNQDQQKDRRRRVSKIMENTTNNTTTTNNNNSSSSSPITNNNNTTTKNQKQRQPPLKTDDPRAQEGNNIQDFFTPSTTTTGIPSSTMNDFDFDD